MVTATGQTVTIQSENYRVTFYAHAGKAGGLAVDGIRIKGWVDNDDVERVLDAWDISGLRRVYREKIHFLTEQPGFRTALFPKTAQKRVYPSLVE